MKKKLCINILTTMFGFMTVGCGFGEGIAMEKENLRLVIDGENKGIDISDNLYGLFFEDINFALDGGMYAEKVINRSFEFADELANNGNLHGYTVLKGANLEVINKNGLNENNPSYAKLTTSEKNVGFLNDGFLEGMYFEKDKDYRFTVYIKSDSYKDRIKVSLKDKKGNEIGVGYFDDITNEWDKKEVIIKSNETVENGCLSFTLENEGEVFVDMVSLFPVDAYKNRENGLRNDMVKMLEELNPTFLRFPGGCIVEGNPLENAYNWKDTVGDVSERKQNENLWLGTKNYPYYQSYGVGFFEYFQLCEDLGAKAIPVVNCGMSCQARSVGQTNTLALIDDIDTYVQDALDLVEFCRGDETTTWGKVRVDMGHPEPFEIEYIGIGNEQWNSEYFERYIYFVEAFREQYPDIKLITTSGPMASGELFDYAWTKIEQHKYDEVKYADLVDEHYYNEPEWFLKHIDKYDSYDRNGAEVFLGEFAAKSNTLKAALSEAAYMTALEKNSDVVKMVAYAPLFGNTVSSQWTPDMIWFNNSEVFGSVNYYMQKMFANNVGDYIINSQLENVEKIGLTGKVGIGTWKTTAVYDDLKVVDNESGKILYANDFSKEDLESYANNYQGKFEILDDESGNKVIGQVDENSPVNDTIGGSAAYFGSDDLTNYTYTLRAKKVSGNEGFLIPFAVKDENNFYHWNIGGWNNTRSCVEEALGGTKNIISEIKGFNIEPNRWYDIKVIVEPTKISCYIDDELIHEVTTKEIYTVYESTSYDEDTKDVIIKLVNINEEDTEIILDLENVNFTGNATVEVLGNNKLDSQNILANKEVLMPKTSAIEITDNYKYIMPKNSVSIFRISTN